MRETKYFQFNYRSVYLTHIHACDFPKKIKDI